MPKPVSLNSLAALAAVSEGQDYYLAGPEFTAADIDLIIYMDRMTILGLEDRFFAKARRPLLHEYLQRIEQRKSVKMLRAEIKKIVPYMFWTVVKSKIPFVTSVTVLGLAIGIETKLDDCDVINCDEFIFSFKNRHKIISHRSGGIALGYRKCLDKCIKTFDTECKFVYWFSVDKKVFDLDENIVFGIVYIPPVNTNYTSEEAFSEIDIEFQRFSQNSKYIVLLGDFNSRTANLPDFYEESSVDEFIVQHFTDQFDYTDVHILDNLNISRVRNTPDDVVNGFGRKLLEFCKSNKVFILNGRVGQDVNAKPTSRNNSVIDYVICTSHFLHT
ncbi:unnamed protein product [Mytilus coruscus]|uniref:GST C-terminal domain-containing protein n=1 Tax=Mytilus coruscus TaxID=42192 RepID=A0A6J8AT47_MYTCO|nr:unnamed protein product [Mytilus coruscus]